MGHFFLYLFFLAITPKMGSLIPEMPLLNRFLNLFRGEDRVLNNFKKDMPYGNRMDTFQCPKKMYPIYVAERT